MQGTVEKIFIDESEIWGDLENPNIDPFYIRELLSKALALKGLTPKESASLLSVKDTDLLEEMYHTARSVKEKIYGNRIVLFAPLYITNECDNNCLYCGFRRDNSELKRRTLTLGEIREEVTILLKEGHKRVLLVAGETKGITLSYLREVIDAIYKMKIDGDNIRRVHVNIAPLTIQEFKELKEMDIGVYQIFQETYSRETYQSMHLGGPKKDYEWRLYAMDRAYKAGLKDLGIGVLFGLHNFKFEVLALLYHSLHLEKEFQSGPHTVSVPRIEPALNAPISLSQPAPVSDLDFKKILSVLRLAIPYTGIIITTREKKELRNELLRLGVSQISAGSRTYPGAYKEHIPFREESQQFSLNDTRSLEEVVMDLLNMDFLPSFCTACYRSGRRGEDFMTYSKGANIHDFCSPNALFTLKEYLKKHAGGNTKRLGEAFIQKEISNIKDDNVKNRISSNLRKIESGKMDLYF
ncbi:[FeFe] hydrogenase H-cluster radical SAM maturase HydG [Candidatus Omnitrophota bacterium]